MNQVIEIDCIGDDVNIQHYEAPATWSIQADISYPKKETESP